MVKLVKSAVKCYKKKTKKTVGGKRKTYEYNQYLVPLKRSDVLECSQEVFVVLQNDLEGLLNEKGELVGDQSAFKRHVEAYRKELDELEWKHGELSKSYKELVSKNTKTNQELRRLTEELKNFHQINQKLEKDLKVEKEDHQELEKRYLREVEKSKIMEEELSKHKGDFWTSIRSKISNKEDKD
ncbi:MAG TPA: hypothetical protein VK444_03110 [Methanobacteriaceae archaeon]|nr:hypothetical protein [Methanobacteriaceae archaeon]